MVGFPKGVVNVVTGFGHDAGAALVEHPLVRRIAFTGGNAGGRKISETAARDFKRVSLELGGKSPNIVFEDADLDAAAKGVIAGVFAASGQTCMAGSRVLVHASVHDELVERVAARVMQRYEERLAAYQQSLHADLAAADLGARRLRGHPDPQPRRQHGATAGAR